MILGLLTRFGASAILGTMTVAIYHALVTSGFNIYLIELLALYFALAFAVILLGPGKFSADYLIKKAFIAKIDIDVSKYKKKTFYNDTSSKDKKNKPEISEKNIFSFPFSSFLSS